MSQEDNPSEPTVDTLDIDQLAADFFAQPEQQAQSGRSEEEQSETKQAPVGVQSEESQESAEAEPQEESKKELLSPLLAAKAKTERELRAKLETAHKEAEKELLTEFLSDPEGFATKHQFTKEQLEGVTLRLYASLLGDEAPEDLRAAIGQSKEDIERANLRKEMEALRAEMVQRETIAQQRAVLEQYQGFTSDIPEQFTYLRAEAESDPSDVVRTFATVADAIYEKTQKYPSASEVAKLIEDQLSAQAERFYSIKQAQNQKAPVKSVAQKPTESVAQPPVKQPTKTLSNQHSGSSASRMPEGEDELFDDAIEWIKQMDPDFLKPPR